MRKLIMGLVFAVTIATTSTVWGKTCSRMPGDNVVSGDVAIGSLACAKKYIDWFWYGFDFHKADWDNGFGYEAACDIDRPLARTFNALYVLQYAAGNASRREDDFSGNILRWGTNYARAEIDELDGRCGSGTTSSGNFALTAHGCCGDNWTRLYWPFFYGEPVVDRAGTIMHEARHAGGKRHSESNACPRGKACDASWNSEGANMYQALWLWWFRVEGQEWATGMRERARDTGNRVIQTAFNTTPPHVIP